MAEHIFKSENDTHSLTRGIEDLCALCPEDWYGTLHEEVVRCRDCDRKDYCCFIYECDYDPNGFCAWGKRKEAENGI